jgi:hypothetical protein
MRITLALLVFLFAACSGGNSNANGTCTFDGQTFTDFEYCPGSTTCCPTYDHCSSIVGGGYSCVAN